MLRIQEFSEKTIWIIIGDLLEFLNDFEFYGLSHGDIKPEYLFMDNNETVKVFAPLLYT